MNRLDWRTIGLHYSYLIYNLVEIKALQYYTEVISLFIVSGIYIIFL